MVQIEIDCPKWKAPHWCLVAKRTISAGVCFDCLRGGKEGRHLLQAVDESNKKTQRIAQPPCRYLGEFIGEWMDCQTCSGSVKLKLFPCDVHGTCTTVKPVNGIACCEGCKERQAA